MSPSGWATLVALYSITPDHNHNMFATNYSNIVVGILTNIQEFRSAQSGSSYHSLGCPIPRQIGETDWVSLAGISLDDFIAVATNSVTTSYQARHEFQFRDISSNALRGNLDSDEFV